MVRTAHLLRSQRDQYRERWSVSCGNGQNRCRYISGTQRTRVEIRTNENGNREGPGEHARYHSWHFNKSPIDRIHEAAIKRIATRSGTNRVNESFD